MTTSAVTPEISTQAEYTTVTKDVAFGMLTNDKGEKEAVVLDLEDAKKLDAEGKFDGTPVTTSITLPVNWAAMIEFANKEYKDDEGNDRDINEVLRDLVTLCRTGMTTKATNRRNQRLLERDKDGAFTFSDSDLTDGKFDLTAEITSPSKRIILTEEVKTWKNLSNLPDATRKSVYDAYLVATGKQPGVYPED